MSEPQSLGYVLVNVTAAHREPYLPHTSVHKLLEDALHEQREWAKKRERYVLCELRVVET